MSSSSDLQELEKKEDKNKPFVHKFFWFNYTHESGKKYPHPDLIEYHALKLANRAKCQILEVNSDEGRLKNPADKNDLTTSYDYFIIAEGRKQKLMLLMMLAKAWLQGVSWTTETKRQRRGNHE